MAYTYDHLRFPHTCTITPRVAGARDAHSQVTYSDGAAVSGVACMYDPRGTREEADARFDGVTEVAKLILPVGATIAQGSEVSAILDADGASLAAGPFEVSGIASSKRIDHPAINHIEARLTRANG